MTAVRHYRNGAPAPLREQIDDFVYQESMHTREHVFFNRQARDAGYDIAPGEGRAARSIAWARARPPLMQPAPTCAMEHFTATLANALSADPPNPAGPDRESHLTRPRPPPQAIRGKSGRG